MVLIVVIKSCPRRHFKPMAKKKYSINWEDDLPVSFEVDGVLYESLEQVPDETDRAKLEAILDSSFGMEFDEAEFEAQMKSGAKAESLILGIFSGVAALMLLAALVLSFFNILKINLEESADGTVVDMVSRREYVNEQDRVVREYYYPVVEFVSRDGRRHSVQMNEGSQTPSHEIGDKVTVLYNPKSPLDARIKSYGSSALMWVLPGITGVLGFGFLGAVIAVRRLMAPSL